MAGRAIGEAALGSGIGKVASVASKLAKVKVFSGIPKKTAVVIGENMDRVKEYARKYRV